MAANGLPPGSDYSRGTSSAAHARYNSTPTAQSPAAAYPDHHDPAGLPPPPTRQESWPHFAQRTLSDPRPQQHPSSAPRSPYDLNPPAHVPHQDPPFYSYQSAPYSLRDQPQPQQPYRPQPTALPPLSMSPLGPSQSASNDWPFPQHQPSISDGAPLVHLSPPHVPGQPVDSDPQSAAAMHAAAGLARPPPQRARKPRKPSNEPNTLEELTDPPAGEKPDYSYPTLIRCAILSHPRQKPTLAEIYDMIHRRFSYFKMDDTSWKNSVRHYLSINPSFVKVQRPITEPGKGNYWTYDPNPPAKAPRKRTNRKRKPDREDDEDSPFHEGARKSFRTDGGAAHSPPQPPSEAGGTPSSSDMGDAATAVTGGVPPNGGSGAPVRIASHRTNPAYQWLEASRQHGIQRAHENLPTPGGLPSPLLRTAPPKMTTPAPRLQSPYDAPFSGAPPAYAPPRAPPPSFAPGPYSGTGATLESYRTPITPFPTSALPPLHVPRADPGLATFDFRAPSGAPQYGGPQQSRMRDGDGRPPPSW